MSSETPKCPWRPIRGPRDAVHRLSETRAAAAEMGRDRRHRLTLLGVTAFIAAAAAGCGGSAKQPTGTVAKSPSTGASTTAAGASTTATGPSGSASPRTVIPAVVGHAKGNVIASVKLTLKGRPYMFLVDTGAAKSIVDSAVAKALALPDRGAPTSTPSLCKLTSQPVAISDWKLGAAARPATTVFSFKTNLSGLKIKGVPYGGSLGADMLSRFGTVTLDLPGKRLILDGKPPDGGKSIPMKIVHAAGQVAVGLPTTIRGKSVVSGFYQVDTGAGRTTIGSRTNRRLALPPAGKSVTGKTGFCAAVTTTPVRIADWTAGGVKLPNTVVLSSSGRKTGLLGLDVLSTFGAVTFDFAGQRMVLGGTVR